MTSKVSFDGAPASPRSVKCVRERTLAGLLRRESSGAIDFRYDRECFLGIPLFDLVVTASSGGSLYRRAVIAVFDNLLPDSDSIRRRVAERVGASGTDAYSMLAALGHDCVGAPISPRGCRSGTCGTN